MYDGEGGTGGWGGHLEGGENKGRRVASFRMQEMFHSDHDRVQAKTDDMVDTWGCLKQLP